MSAVVINHILSDSSNHTIFIDQKAEVDKTKNKENE